MHEVVGGLGKFLEATLFVVHSGDFMPHFSHMFSLSNKS